MQEHSTGLHAHSIADFPQVTADLAGLEPHALPRAGKAQPAKRGGAEGDALKLDTRTLTGNPDWETPSPAILSYDDEEYLGRPINYPVYEKAIHFRAKVQEFSGGGYEVTLSSINMQRISDQALKRRRVGPRVAKMGNAKDDEKSARRSKRMVRLKCKEMGASHLVTLTTRATITIEQLKAAFARFVDNLEYHFKRKFEYVCVPERHPSNPEHLHLHCAIRDRLTAREMVMLRYCWYVALGGDGKAKGAQVPGGFNIREIRVKGGLHRRMDKIASYMSKYMTKESLVAFNKKSYWSSRINIIEARKYWLRADNINDALMEFLKEFDCFPTDSSQDFFKARNQDLIWMRYVPLPDEVIECPF